MAEACCNHCPVLFINSKHFKKSIVRTILRILKMKNNLKNTLVLIKQPLSPQRYTRCCCGWQNQVFMVEHMKTLYLIQL